MSLFDSLNDFSTSKNLFPVSKRSTPTHGLFGSPHSTLETESGAVGFTNVPNTRLDQKVPPHSSNLADEQLAENRNSFSTGIQKSGLFSNLTTQSTVSSGSSKLNLFLGITTSTSYEKSTPKLFISNTKNCDLGRSRLLHHFPQSSCPNREEQTTITRQTDSVGFTEA